VARMSGWRLLPVFFVGGLVLAGRAQAETIAYVALLDGASESPPVTSDGIGYGIVTLDTVANTMRVETGFSGLSGNVTVAHVHCCTLVPGTGTIGVATMTPSFPGFPSGVTAGEYDQTFDMQLAGSWNATFINNFGGGTPLGAFAALSAGLDAGSAYLNIHSSFAAGGEIRGFLLRKDLFADGFEP
jgi:hypothetical protein